MANVIEYHARDICKQFLSGAKYLHRERDISQNGGMKKTDIRQALASNLRTKMQKAGLKQIGLAERSGVSQGHISDILNCTTKVSLDLIGDLAFALHCEPWELLVDSEATRQNALSKVLGYTPDPPKLDPQPPPAKLVAAKKTRRRKPESPRPGGGAQ